MRNIKKASFGFSLTLLFCFLSLPAFADTDSALKILEAIPVQHAGRIKPFQSFANEAVLYVTGRSRFKGIDSVKLIWQWMAKPEKWNQEPIIPVKYKPLKEELDLMVIDDRISAEVILAHEPFTSKVRASAMRQAEKEDLTDLEKKRMEVYERAVFFQRIGQGLIPGWIAHPDDPRSKWMPLQALSSPSGQEAMNEFFQQRGIYNVREATLALLNNIQDSEEGVPDEEVAGAFSESIGELFMEAGLDLDHGVIQTELAYNRINPFHWAWIFYLLSVFMGLLQRGQQRGVQKGQSLKGQALQSPKGPTKGPVPEGTGPFRSAFAIISLVFFVTAFLIHGSGFVMRCLISGRPPVTNMYESMIWVSWAASLFALILYGVYRSVAIRNTAAIVTAVTLILAEQFPVALNPAISPLVPVLRSNLWLTVHVLTITLSYGAFALAWGLGHAVIYQFAFKAKQSQAQRRLSQYLYRSLQIGVVLLATGTILGGVWANYSWGRFWGWDPKETWALIALLGYLVVLHGRFTGWLGHFGIAVGSVVAFLGILMAWYGVNFVLGAGLHSYGFGGGGLGNVLSAVFADMAVIGFMVWKYKRQHTKKLEWRT